MGTQVVASLRDVGVNGDWTRLGQFRKWDADGSSGGYLSACPWTRRGCGLCADILAPGTVCSNTWSLETAWPWTWTRMWSCRVCDSVEAWPSARMRLGRVRIRDEAVPHAACSSATMVRRIRVVRATDSRTRKPNEC